MTVNRELITETTHTHMRGYASSADNNDGRRKPLYLPLTGGIALTTVYALTKAYYDIHVRR